MSEKKEDESLVYKRLVYSSSAKKTLHISVVSFDVFNSYSTDVIGNNKTVA